METASAPKFVTLQLFVWRGPEDDAIVQDIMETGVAFAHVLKDMASERITRADGERVELRAYDAEMNDLGKWPLVWDMPTRCRKERPCVVVDSAPIDMVAFVKARS